MSLLNPISDQVNLSKFQGPSIKRPDFIITRRHPDLTATEEAEFVRYAQCEEPFPCREPLYTGRSVYAESAPESSLRQKNIFGIKGKGFTGLSDLYLVAPSPDKKYSKGDTPHIILNHHMEMKIVYAGPKALNSLLHVGATNEFDFNNALFKAGVGFRGLLAGKFGSDDHPELDLFDQGTKKRQTGGVFLEFNPEVENFGGIVQFTWNRLNYEDVQIGLSKDTHLWLDTSLRELVLVYLARYRNVAKANAGAIFDAHVGRHSSVGTNFMYNCRTDQAFQVDTDTCINIQELDLNQRGPQVIRDIANFMQKKLVFLTICALSPDFENIISNRRPISPFKGVLEEFFGRFVNQSEIDITADRLRARLVKFLGDRKESLPKLKSEYVERLSDSQRESYLQIEHKFSFVMSPFLCEIIFELYRLLKGSKFESAGYPLPTVSLDALREQHINGIIEYRNAWRKKWGF